MGGVVRVANGKIVEHGDVIQEVPEKSANNNAMPENQSNESRRRHVFCDSGAGGNGSADFQAEAGLPKDDR